MNNHQFGRPVIIKDEGVTVTENTASIDTVGAGITTTGSENDVTATIPGVDEIAIWGGITGTLSNQTDLQAELDLRALKSGTLSQFAATTSLQLKGVISDETGSGLLVFATSPTLITPALGTPTALVGTNITGTAAGLTAGNVTTNANLTGHITSTGNAAILGSFTSLQLKTALTDETGSGAVVFANTPTLIAPLLGTPTSGVATNITGLPAAAVLAGTFGTGAYAMDTSLDVGGTTLLASRALTIDTGGVFNIVLASAAGDDFTVDTNKLVVEGDTGNVGIGTASPGTHLTVSGVGSQIAIKGTDTTSSLYQTFTDSTDSRVMYAGIENSAGTTFWTGNLANAGIIGMGTNHPFVIGTNNLPRVTILSTGNVGIGTTAPDTNLVVYESNTDTNPAFTIEQASTGDAALEFLLTGSRSWSMGIDNSDTDKFKLTAGGDLDTNVFLTVDITGNVGIGLTSPTAYLHLKAGTASVSTSPLKFTSGTVNTTAEVGAVEYNNTFHLTNSDATRRHIATAPNTTKVTAGAPYTNDGYVVINIGGTDFKVMTTA